jgi:hypothetical protein
MPVKVKPVVAEIHKDADGILWLCIRDTKNRSAMYNIEALAEKQSPLLGKIMRQWAEDHFTLTETL